MNTFKILQGKKIPALQASKWMRTQVLLDEEEMALLFSIFPELKLFDVSRVLPLQELTVSSETFLQGYKKYIQALLKGKEFTQRHLFSLALSPSPDNFCALKIKEDRFLLKPIFPVIQMQKHNFLISEEGKPLSMVQGEGAISFGLQFSYPAIFQDPCSMEIKNVLKEKDFAKTTGMYKKLTKFLREHTRPLPVFWQGRTIRLPMRLGKKCFAWIHKHPDLQKRVVLSEN
ncbi:MAG: hypothetical protein Tsb0015_05870 [Simkaniaceae bacterium]